MTPNLNLYPPEGYVFVDARAGTVTGGNWPEVINKLRAFRVGAGLPVGDVKAEVFAWFCQRHPDYCRDGGVNSGETRKVAVKQSDFPSQVITWLAAAFTSIFRQKLGFVDTAEAKRRAEICAVCPKHVVWRTGCMGCNKNIHTLVDQALKGRKEPAVAAGLQGCAVFAEDVRLAVHLNQPPKSADGKPGHCWR